MIARLEISHPADDEVHCTLLVDTDARLMTWDPTMIASRHILNLLEAINLPVGTDTADALKAMDCWRELYV